MPPQRTRLSPRVQADLNRKLFADRVPNPYDTAPPVWVTTTGQYLLSGFIIVWGVLALAALICLVLFAFGQNYTVAWLVVAGWLLAASCIVGGVYWLIDWGYRYAATRELRVPQLLVGLALVGLPIATISFVLLGASSLALTMLAVASLGGSALFGLHQAFSKAGTSRLAAGLLLIGALCFGASLVLMLMTRFELLPIPPHTQQSLTALRSILTQFGLACLVGGPLLERMGNKHQRLFFFGLLTTITVYFVVAIVVRLLEAYR